MAKKKKKISNTAKKSATSPTLDAPYIAQDKSIKVGYQSFIAFCKSHWLANIMIIVASIAIYAQTYTYEYVLDDAIVITDNDYTQKGWSGISEIFTTESFQGYFKVQKDLLPGARYRPLSIASFAIEKSIFGQSSAVGHMLNMIFYAIVCIFLFRMLSMLFPRLHEPWYFGFAFVAAFIFTIHPLHTEAVANVKGRDEIFVILFSILSTIACIKAINHRFWLNLILGGILLFVGLMAKENAITFLAIIPVTQYFFTKATWRQIASTIFVLCIPIIAYLLIRYQVIGYFLDSGKEMADVMNNPFVGMTSNEKYATILYTLGLYFKLAFVPHPLTHDYYPYHIPILSWSDIRAIVSVVLYGVLALLAMILLPRKHIVSYCIIVYLAALSIVSNLFFTVGTFMNERFLIISTIGTSIFCAYLFKDVISKRLGKRGQLLGLIIFGLYSMALLGKSITRVPAWENPLSLNSTAVKVSKNSARVNTFMCTALFEKAKLETNRDEKLRLFTEAEQYAERSITILPTFLNGNKMRAGVAAEIYKIDRNLDKLLTVFDNALARNPAIAFVYEYLAYLNRTGADQKKLLNFYYQTGYSHLSGKQNKNDWAVKVLNMGLELDPNNVRINSAIGQIYTKVGNANKAYPYLKRAGLAK